MPQTTTRSATPSSAAFRGNRAVDEHELVVAARRRVAEQRRPQPVDIKGHRHRQPSADPMTPFQRGRSRRSRRSGQARAGRRTPSPPHARSCRAPTHRFPASPTGPASPGGGPSAMSPSTMDRRRRPRRRRRRLQRRQVAMDIGQDRDSCRHRARLGSAWRTDHRICRNAGTVRSARGRGSDRSPSSTVLGCMAATASRGCPRRARRRSSGASSRPSEVRPATSDRRDLSVVPLHPAIVAQAAATARRCTGSAWLGVGRRGTQRAHDRHPLAGGRRAQRPAIRAVEVIRSCSTPRSQTRTSSTAAALHHGDGPALDDATGAPRCSSRQADQRQRTGKLADGIITVGAPLEKIEGSSPSSRRAPRAAKDRTPCPRFSIAHVLGETDEPRWPTPRSTNGPTGE